MLSLSLPIFTILLNCISRTHNNKNGNNSKSRKVIKSAKVVKLVKEMSKNRKRKRERERERELMSKEEDLAWRLLCFHQAAFRK